MGELVFRIMRGIRGMRVPGLRRGGRISLRSGSWRIRVSRRHALVPIAAASVALLAGCGVGASADQRLKAEFLAEEVKTGATAPEPEPKDWNHLDTAATESGAGAAVPGVAGGGLPGVGKQPASGDGLAALNAHGTYDYQAAGFRLQNPCDIIPAEVFRREGLTELPDGRVNEGVAGKDQMCGVRGREANFVFVSSHINQYVANRLGHTQLHFSGPDNSTYAVIREEPDAVICSVGADTAMGFFGLAAFVDEAPLHMNDVETCSHLNDWFVALFADYPELIGPGLG